MNINSIPTAAIASTVWNAVTRTLTADPATDAGAATFVWTHAARTLTADPATDAGAATLVWTHAARTLTADPATDAGAATLVWTHAARTLTADPATDAGAATLVWTHSVRMLSADLSSQLNDEGVTQNVTTSAVQNTLGSYVQVVASTAHTVRGITIDVQSPTAANYRLVISTGGAGSEVVKAQFFFAEALVSGPHVSYIQLDASIIPKGVRVAIAASNTSGANANVVTVGITLREAND